LWTERRAAEQAFNDLAARIRRQHSDLADLYVRSFCALPETSTPAQTVGSR
jgi:hypothetical protein